MILLQMIQLEYYSERYQTRKRPESAQSACFYLHQKYSHLHAHLHEPEKLSYRGRAVKRGYHAEKDLIMSVIRAEFKNNPMIRALFLSGRSASSRSRNSNVARRGGRIFGRAAAQGLEFGPARRIFRLLAPGKRDERVGKPRDSI